MGQRHQRGRASLWLVLGVVIVIGAGAAGYVLFSRGRTPPFVGVWKIEKHSVYGSAEQAWLEDLPIPPTETHIRFTKDGTACRGALTDGVFVCPGQEMSYTVARDVIEVPGTATPIRLRWHLVGDILELTEEHAPSGAWLPREKYELTRVP